MMTTTHASRTKLLISTMKHSISVLKRKKKNVGSNPYKLFKPPFRKVLRTAYTTFTEDEEDTKSREKQRRKQEKCDK